MNLSYDIIGDIAILKFPYKDNLKSKTKKNYAEKFLKENQSIKSIFEKTGKFSGRLRKQKLNFLSGEKRTETIHNENACRFFLDIEKTYFSPRLSNERKLIAEDILKLSKKIKNKVKILVMFAGVGIFPIVIAKYLKQNRLGFEIISNELNKQASKYAEKNIKLNKLTDYIKVIQGDSNKINKKLDKNYKADFIVMPRPNLKDTFLKPALELSKKSTKIYYYGFGEEQKVLNEIDTDIKKSRKSTNKIKIRKAGEIAPYKFRFLAEFNIK